MSRSTASLVMVYLLQLVTVPAGACSLAGCLDRGIEMRSDFAVKIRHADKPLPGTTVEISGFLAQIAGDSGAINTVLKRIGGKLGGYGLKEAKGVKR